MILTLNHACMHGSLSQKINGLLYYPIGAYPLYVPLIYTLLHKYEDSRKGLSERVFTEKMPGYLTKLRTYIKSLSTHKSAEVDILFVSYYRPLKDGTDYLFSAIIQKLYKDYSLALMTKNVDGRCYNDARVINLNLYDCLSLKILLMAVVHALVLYIKYRILKPQLTNSERNLLNKFFWPPHLFSMHLEGLCLARAIQKLQPKLILANDDALRFKPITYHGRFIVLQAASIHQDYQRYAGHLYKTFPLEHRVLSDCYLVSGPKIKQIKETFSNDTKRVIVVGQPRYNSMIKTVDVKIEAN